MKHCRIILLLCLFLAACTESESGRFAPPSFVSVESEQIGDAIVLRCTLSDGRVERCGFRYGAGGQLDRAVECVIDGTSFEARLTGLADGVDYSYRSYAAAGDAEIQSDVFRFRLEIPVPEPEEPSSPYPPDDEIWYTTISGTILGLDSKICVNLNMVSNTYADGKGVMKFNGPVANFKEWAIYKKNDLTELILPSSVKVTSYSCFREDQQLQKVVFAPGLVILGDSSLHHNEALEEVILPDTVTSIEKDALSHAYSLRHIDLPPNLEKLGRSAFLYCKTLESIVLPATLKSIGIYCFEHDKALTSITCLATEPPTGSTEMFDDTSECPIYVPAASAEAYRSAPYWNKYAHRIREIEE